jgi:hypothetical protein
MTAQIPRSLAGRIDRLSRRAQRFHRFAHHPLCSRYAGELIPLGHRVRICRGCSFFALGAAFGMVLGFILRPTSAVALGLLLLAIAFAWSSMEGRLPKSASRFLPAILFGIALTSPPIVVALTLGTLAVMSWVYRRRGPHRSPCRLCPEREMEVCGGFRPIVRRERAFRRLAHRWLTSLPPVAIRR